MGLMERILGRFRGDDETSERSEIADSYSRTPDSRPEDINELNKEKAQYVEEIHQKNEAVLTKHKGQGPNNEKQRVPCPEDCDGSITRVRCQFSQSYTETEGRAATGDWDAIVVKTSIEGNDSVQRGSTVTVESEFATCTVVECLRHIPARDRQRAQIARANNEKTAGQYHGITQRLNDPVNEPQTKDSKEKTAADVVDEAAPSSEESEVSTTDNDINTGV